jgi:hypothetical protein
MMYGLFRHFEELVAVSKSREKLQALADQMKELYVHFEYDIREVRELE